MRRLPLLLCACLVAAPSFAAKPPPNKAVADIPPRPSRVGLPAIRGVKRADAPLVVIDAGHGGHDPGSSSSDGSVHEKDVALAIAKEIEAELIAGGKVRVALTRTDDRFLVLAERREIARRLGADLFISVHCDSAPNDQARGASIYTLSDVSSDRTAAALAARENKADVINGVDLNRETSDVSSILIDLARRETMIVSSNFATELGKELAPVIGLKPNFHKFAGLMVLKAPDVPSILLESGYISNDDDLALLQSSGYREKIATGIRHAVEVHFARRLAGKTTEKTPDVDSDAAKAPATKKTTTKAKKAKAKPEEDDTQ